MAQMYNPYGAYTSLPYSQQNQSAPQTWLPQSSSAQNVNLPYVTPPSTPQQKPTVFGKVVTDESQITPNDVPMDGTIAIFPLQDYSKIIAKQWTANGTIQTLTYIPEHTQADNTPKTTLDDVMTHMDERLDQIEDLFTTPTNKKVTSNVQSA